MKSVPSRSHRCPPNRGTAGVLTLRFTTTKVSIILMQWNRTRRVLQHTHTSTNTCWCSKHKPTKLHHTFQFRPTTQTMQNLNFLRRRNHFLHSRSHKKHRVKILKYLWVVRPRISSLPVYFKPPSICYRERLLVIYFKTVAHTCWDFRFCTFCTIDMKNTSSPAACCEEMCCYF